MKIILLILSISFFGCSCFKTPKEQKIEIQPNDVKNEQTSNSPDTLDINQSDVELINQIKTKAVDVLELDGQTFLLKGQAVRNFMPTLDIDTSGSRLSAGVSFLRYPFRDFPVDYSYLKHMKFIKLHVIQHPKIWSSVATQVQNSPPGTLLATDGPRWKRDTFVEMVLELDYKGQRKFIIDRAIPIDGPE